MLHDTTSDHSLELTHDAQFDPEPLGVHTPLHRNSTNVLELSRIISALKDDHELDNEEFEKYRNRPVPEEVLLEQGTQISRQATKVEQEDDLGNLGDNDHPPDGAFAFWQAFLVMLMVFSTWGANAAFGVFLNFYMTNDSFKGADQYDFALIGGIVVFLAQFLAPLSIFCVRVFGPTPVHLTGVAIQTVAYFLAAQCTQLWQIYLCQGLLVGFSFSFVFLPGTVMLPTWFEKRKATSMGIAVAGAGLGGLVFSLSLNKLIEQTGSQKWPLRAVGFITLATSLFGTCFLRPRNNKKVDLKVTLTKEFFRLNAKLIIAPSVFNNLPMIFVGCWFGIALMGYVIVLYSFSAYATSVGLSHTQSNNLLAILNAAQVVGRPIVGNLGDYFGRHTTACVFCTYVAILILAFWTEATSYTSLIVLAVLIGGPVGVGSTMAQSLAADVLAAQGRPEKLPAAWAGLNIIVSIFSLPSEVIALKLRQPSAGKKSYYHSQIFTGCCFFFCLLLALTNREYLVRKTFESRRAHAEDVLRKQRNTYLTREALEKENSETEEILEGRIAWYNRLLGAKYALVRMFYPIRV